MLRKNIRLRKEYLFHKEKENKNEENTRKKLKLKSAIDENLTRIPTELFKEEQTLRKSLQLSDQNTLINRTHIDDEYMTDFYREPKVVIVTSRSPSTRLTQFHKEMNLFFPNSIRMNRGDTTLKDLMDMAERKDVTDFVLLHEHRGEPDGMIITHLPLGPTVYFGISNAVLRHDLENRASTMSEAYPHLIFDNFTTPLGERLQKILSSVFPIPKMESKRVVTFSNRADTISVRHHNYEKPEYNKVDLDEIGPRFELRPYQVRLGTMIQTEASNEWVLRPYMNTATKRRAIGN